MPALFQRPVTNHSSIHTATPIYNIGAKMPTIVSEPKVAGGTYGVRYAMTRATESEMVTASSRITNNAPRKVRLARLWGRPKGSLL